MENYILYLIFALSLSLTVTLTYGLDIIKTIHESLIVLDIEVGDFNWNSGAYLLVFFLFSLVFSPITVYFMVRYDKWHVVKIFSKQVLINTFKAGK